MEATDGDNEEPSFRCRCRCLDAARYVLAAVMTLLVVSITINTVKLVLYEQSHDPVSLWVARGLVVCVEATTNSSSALMLYHGLRVSSDRGFVYYAANVTACLFPFNDTEGTLGHDPFFCFRLNSTVRAVQQQEQSYLLMEAVASRSSASAGTAASGPCTVESRSPNCTSWNTTLPEPYFVTFHNISRGSPGVYKAVLRVWGMFIAERRSGRLNTTSWNAYKCGLVTVVGLERNNSKNDDELPLDRSEDWPCDQVENTTNISP